MSSERGSGWMNGWNTTFRQATYDLISAEEVDPLFVLDTLSWNPDFEDETDPLFALVVESKELDLLDLSMDWGRCDLSIEPPLESDPRVVGFDPRVCGLTPNEKAISSPSTEDTEGWGEVCSGLYVGERGGESNSPSLMQRRKRTRSLDIWNATDVKNYLEQQQISIMLNIALSKMLRLFFGLLSKKLRVRF